MGAVPNPLLITAGGRLMILEQVRFGVSSLTVNKNTNGLKAITIRTYTSNSKVLPPFRVPAIKVLLLFEKTCWTPMMWAFLWLQGLQVLPVSGPTFGQSCGLQSTHHLLPDFGSPLKVSKT